MYVFDWFREQKEKHGLRKAISLFGVVYGARARTLLANSLPGLRVECPVCRWRGRRFYDYIDGASVSPGVECPQCLSHGRHRALFSWLRDDFRLAEKSGRALVCAPEKPIAPLWQSSEKLRVFKTDIEPTRGVDALADLQFVPFGDNSFDIVWCHHVLEQVPDDALAMRELERVLSADGVAVISSAIADSDTTNEFGGANVDHFNNWRIYGRDFPSKLSAAGFKVEPVNFGLSAEDCDRFGIDAGELVFVCSKGREG